ncbi:MAG: hypothetical protein HQK59_05730 [Deltaproteobacteria bacterium]|nr:hypothetical protein [Deltaproteobacteria bacterium]
MSVVPGKAKSAATMICFGSSRIIMGTTSELGPIDPQIYVPKDGSFIRCSAHNIIQSYKELFERAVGEKGNLQPYLLQLSRYDEREIKELQAAIELSEDIAIRALKSGMMSEKTKDEIKNNIDIFLTPETTKVHGRPIYRDEGERHGICIEKIDNKEDFWHKIYELYIRTDNLVSTRASKCFESKDFSFIANP